MVARVGSPVDAADVAAFNEQHNSASQRAWMAEHVRSWAATQSERVQPFAAELVSGCRWLVRSSNADLVLPLAPKSPALLEPCIEFAGKNAMTRGQFLHATHLEWSSESHAADGVRARVYAAVYEFPAEKVAAKLARESAREESANGTGAVLLLESLDLCKHEHWMGRLPWLTGLPSGLDVAGSLLVRHCHEMTTLPQRVGWDLDASQSIGLQAAALVDVGGSVSLEHCRSLVSMAECQITHIRGPLNMEHCGSLVELPPKLARIGGFLDLTGCGSLRTLPDPLVVEGNTVDLKGCRGLGTALGSGLRAKTLMFEETDITALPSSAVFSGGLSCGAALTFLPEDLVVVHGDLETEAGSQLRRLPAGLREVHGDLNLESPLLRELPPKLHVHGRLDWVGDADRLPEGLRVDGQFALEGHPRLTELPADLAVGGTMYLGGLAGLQRLSPGVRVVRGFAHLRGCANLVELPHGFEVQGSLDLENCASLERLAPGLMVGGWLDVSGCSALTGFPRDMVVKDDHISHIGCTSLRWHTLLEWTDPEDPKRSLDALLPRVFGFLTTLELRAFCAFVSRAWRLAAHEQAPPCALKGCRGDWVTRVIKELSARNDPEAGAHLEPSAQWQSSPHVRVEKLRPGSEENVVVAEVVVSAEAPQAVPQTSSFFNSQPAAGLKKKAGDDFAIAPGDFSGTDLHGANAATATVEGVEEDGSVRLKATFTFKHDPSIWGWEHCTVVSPRHEAAWEEAQNQPAREGVCFVDGDVPAELLQRLQTGIDALAAGQPADYHPNSRDIVRDHVHPALYPFIRGTSAFEPSADLSAPPEMPAPLPPGHRRVDVTAYDKADKWGRPYERSQYQWLPTFFDVAADSGNVTIRGDINNLRPRAAHEPLYGALADLFQGFLTEIDVAHAYAHQVDFYNFDDPDEPKPHFLDMDRELLELPRLPRAAAAWQVITKIVDYELQPGQSYDGVWHVEGMSHEHILCTCLYVLDRGGDIEGGELKFKRALTYAEGEKAKNSFGQEIDCTTRRMLDSKDALVPLGKVATPAGRRVVFPNSHVHRLSELENTGTAPQRRRIIAFFVVDPKARIVSTQECPDQTPTMTREQALQHRLNLMEERRLHKQDWNVRNISLCEH